MDNTLGEFMDTAAGKSIVFREGTSCRGYMSIPGKTNHTPSSTEGAQYNQPTMKWLTGTSGEMEQYQ